MPEVKSKSCTVSAICRQLHKLWTQCSEQLGSIRPHLESCPVERNILSEAAHHWAPR